MHVSCAASFGKKRRRVTKTMLFYATRCVVGGSTAEGTFDIEAVQMDVWKVETR